MPSDLAAVLQQWLDEEMDSTPVRASALGIDGYDDRLGDHSEAAIRACEQRDDRFRATLESFTDDALSLDDQIDRDLVLASLRGRLVMRDWANWRRDPALYLGPCLQGVFTLFLNRLHPEPDLVRFAEARLRAVPEVLAAGKANLSAELANPVIVGRGAGQAGAGITYARELVPAEVSDPALRARLAEAGEVAAEAFADFCAFLEDLAPRAQGPYAIGEERYSGLLEQKELLGYGAGDMRERGRAAYAELDAEMQELASKVRNTTDWRAVVEELNDDHPSSPDDMRQKYEDWTERARQFLRDNELVTLPDGEQCLVDPSPPFQRPIMAVASYSSPPAFKPGLTGHFFVPYPPEGAPPEEVAKRLATNSHSSIPTIAVHEAYPGHHWHLSWMQKLDRPVRKVVWTSYFVEGWALYAERLMREQGFFTDPAQELCHLDARIFRAARIVVDTSLHIGDMTFEEAVEFMRTKASLSEPTARAEVGRYCTWPTQASSYLTGSLEIERIRAAYFDRGLGDVRSFNDTIAGSGGLPIALAERAVIGSA
ncbi:MAG: DUF885 domain-containing protein [Actinobacteria bacterium]|nr:DUF885 domain-containing protein [Actinomycetota bacterium]